MLLDSNVIIYISKDLSFSKRLQGEELYASMVSRVEVLGFHKITEQDKIDILVTANVDDFLWIKELKIINPLS